MAIRDKDPLTITRTRCEDVVYKMWEKHMDEYLEKERAWVSEEMMRIARKWQEDVSALTQLNSSCHATQRSAPLP